ncbi:MAG: PD-(D/E)XK nuclease family protein, partial [Candidatus Neomarinimicrobiota bacterium]
AEGIEAFMGKRVHETLEFLYNQVKLGQILLIDDILDKYNELWKSEFHNKIAIVRREFNWQQYFNLGERCLAGYYRNYSPFNEPVEGNEVEIIFRLDDSDNYVIKGIVDRIDQVKHGHFEIHDYKSGKRVLSQSQADQDGQLALYQIGLTQIRDPVESVDLVWHFLQAGLEVRSKRTPVQLQTLIEKTKSKIDKIRIYIKSHKTFKARESILCNWCYYWEECHVKSGGNPFLPKHK